MKDAPLYDLMSQDNIETENQFIYFSDSNWHDYPDIDRSTESFQLKIGFSFPLLRANDIRLSLLIIRACSFFLGT